MKAYYNLKVLLFLLVLFMFTSCENIQPKAKSDKKIQVIGIENLNNLQMTDILLVSDHTPSAGKSNELVSLAGADSKERSLIDPVIREIAKKSVKKGLSVSILNVENLGKEFNSIDDWYTAYDTYDSILDKFANSKSTIFAIHFDAEELKDENGVVTYNGGIQVIIDSRGSVMPLTKGKGLSDGTKKIADQLIKNGVLNKLNEKGMNFANRSKDGFDTKTSYVIQKNLTARTISSSDGGGLLIELGPFRQAMRLYKTPEKMVKHFDKALDTLVNTTYTFRKMN